MESPSESTFLRVFARIKPETLELHWMLDVAFKEDRCLIHEGFAPQNLALLRKMALALLKIDTSKTASISRKQKMAGWDDEYAFKIISAE